MKNNWDSFWSEEPNRIYWLEPDKAVIQLEGNIDRTIIKDVLDLGCGIGRHAIYFARNGYNVTAVDSSTEALNVLKQQVSEQDIKVKIINGNFAQDLFQKESFDLVLAYNVLYHGYRDTFKNAVGIIHKWLKSEGIFFFTCPSRWDGKYGNGELVAPNTYRPLNSIHPGDIHYFSDENDISDFLVDFSDISIDINQHYWDDDNSIKQFSSYWQVLAKK